MSERIEIPAEKLHEEMLKLRQGKHMDFLRSLTGMDWGEEGLGVVYHLEDTNTRENIVVSTRTTNREKPELPSVSDIWKGAEFNEREVYDYYGIRFIGHPDMRRLFLRDDWVGYPLRKDYDESLNPLRMTNEEPVDTTQYIEVQHDGSVIEKRETIFDEDEYIINIGPQHPATHGVLRFRVSLEGEIIKKLDVHCGYIHRGIEKMCESLTYPQTLALTDRLDYLGAHQNRHALCMCQLSQLSEEIDCCISGLSEQCRRVFLLSRTTGLKNREIAERLNISVKTVEKHIGAALSQLRLRLSRSGFLRLFL